MRNIKFSGLKGQALVIKDKDIPSIKEFQDVIPDHYFRCNTKTSLRYLLQSAFIQSLVVAIGLSIPFTPKMIPIWIIYALISGTTAMGFWVIAHECGHGAFSKNKTLESVTGYLLHSLLLVPYFSWQRSHAVHHRFTNNITNGETHVPLVIKGNGVTEKVGGEKELHFSNSLGKKNYGILQLVLHLIFGWPAYLLTGSTGGPLLVVNCWLVVYTWLHHTDSDVPHLSNTEFSFMRGAFLSIDRPYGRVLNFLHHNIGSSHVVHHVCPTIPHYHAKKATVLIKKAFKKAYLFNPDPIHKALWNIACNCVAVKSDIKRGRYIWQSSYKMVD